MRKLGIFTGIDRSEDTITTWSAFLWLRYSGDGRTVAMATVSRRRVGRATDPSETAAATGWGGGLSGVEAVLQLLQLVRQTGHFGLQAFDTLEQE